MSNRFKEHNAHAIVQFLKETGEDVEAYTYPPETSLFGGCSDPLCCSQHHGVANDGTAMLSVKTKVSNTRLSKILVELKEKE